MLEKKNIDRSQEKMQNSTQHNKCRHNKDNPDVLSFQDARRGNEFGLFYSQNFVIFLKNDR